MTKRRKRKELGGIASGRRSYSRKLFEKGCIRVGPSKPVRRESASFGRAYESVFGRVGQDSRVLTKLEILALGWLSTLDENQLKGLFSILNGRQRETFVALYETAREVAKSSFSTRQFAKAER